MSYSALVPKFKPPIVKSSNLFHQYRDQNTKPRKLDIKNGLIGEALKNIEANNYSSRNEDHQNNKKRSIFDDRNQPDECQITELFGGAMVYKPNNKTIQSQKIHQETNSSQRSDPRDALVLKGVDSLFAKNLVQQKSLQSQVPIPKPSFHPPAPQTSFATIFNKPENPTINAKEPSSKRQKLSSDAIDVEKLKVYFHSLIVSIIHSPFFFMFYCV
jgi:hypothetical protein